ncbi:MAG: hypothetical protein EOP36_18100 [Rubrivivax sp.]|nr:MAG: hypothetical protein EOP36_18100 [Rubrivivax sp.]
MTDLTPRPQLRTQTTPARSGVHAQVGNYVASLPADNSGLAGLVQGLSALNPALQRFTQQQGEETRAEVQTLGKAGAQEATAPRDALTGAPAAVPLNVPPAYGEVYRAAFKDASVQRAGLETKADVVQRFHAEKDAEGFVPDTWLANERSKALAGIQEPRLRAAMGEHFSEVEQGIRHELTKAAIEKHEETKVTTAFTLLSGLSSDLNADDIATRYQAGLLPQLSALKMDKKQAAGLLLSRVMAISNEVGGRPEVFDVFDKPDAEGHTILARNPQLAPAIQQARDHAKLTRDRKIHEDTEDDRAKTLMGYDDDIRERPQLVTPERLIADIGPNGISAEKAADLYHRARVERGKQAAHAQLMDDANNGRLGFWDPKDQNKAMDEMLGPQARQLWEAATSGDSAKVQALASALMQRHSQSGATVPIDSLVRFMETSITNLPGTDGPSPKFLATAEVYKALAADKNYRGLYFKDKVADIMDAYDRHTQQGIEPKTAYQAAYRVISPEFQAEIKKRTEAPEFKDKVGKIARKYTEGSSMWGFIGGNGRPENVTLLNTWAAGEVRRITELNPDLLDDPKALQDHIERHAQTNFVLDTSSQLAVKVPPQFAGAMTQEALSAYSKELIAFRKLGEDSRVRYIPLNDQGLYEVQYWTGSRVEAEKGQLNLPDVVNRYRASKVINPETEGVALNAFKQAIRDGKPVPQLDPGLLHKARSVGALSAKELDKAEEQHVAAFRDAVRKVPDLGFGKPTLDNTLPAIKGTKVDYQLTSRIANDLAFGPGAGREDHMALAGSLIAIREGVVLSATPDPNPAAGINIGAGYNLKANAATVNSDLKRAGIPEDRIEDVKAGRAALTPDNVRRLIQVALPRYEEGTRKAAEEAAPGLWSRMTPQQRAVMVDISYQVGNASGFKKAWAALDKGDTVAFQDEVGATYRNAKGSQVEDTRGKDLRASLLMGPSHWNARVRQVSRAPSNPIQASSLTKGKD